MVALLVVLVFGSIGDDCVSECVVVGGSGL